MTKLIKRRNLSDQPSKPLETHPSASCYNPSILVKNGGKDYLKIDLLTMVMSYAPTPRYWDNVEVYLDDKRIGK